MEVDDQNGVVTPSDPSETKNTERLNDPQGPQDSEDNDDSEGSEDYEDPEYEAKLKRDVFAPEEEYFASIDRHPIPMSIHEIGILLNSKKRAVAKGPGDIIGTAWIDVDDSGTYDPKNGCVTPPRQPKKPRILRDPNDDDAPRAPRLQRPRVGYGLLVTFTFELEQSLDYLRSICPVPSQPTHSDNILSESVDPEVNSFSHGSSRSLRKAKTSNNPNALLSRYVTSEPPRDWLTIDRLDGLTLDQLTEGHPQRRGCKGCFNLGDDDCSLIDFGDTYPCTACEDTGIDCELIIPRIEIATTPEPSKPVKKKSARRAVVADKKSGQAEHRAAVGDKKTDQAEQDTSGSPRRQTKPPKPPKPPKPTKSSSKIRSKKKPSSSATIPHQKIKTCFAHPIEFNYVPDPEGKQPCSWCDMPFFGLWGHGEVEVEVIPFGVSIGYEEVEGGHSIAGKEKTKMCIACTFYRIRITTCEGHLIKKIKDLNKRSFDTNELKESFRALHAGDIKGGELASKTKWCSVCVAVAEFKCITTPLFDDYGNPVSEEHTAEGCGLLLCSTCYDTVERIERSRGNARIILMDTLVRLRRQELWRHNRSMTAEGGDWVRADADFLTSKGELMVRMREMNSHNDAAKDPTVDRKLTGKDMQQSS